MGSSLSVELLVVSQAPEKNLGGDADGEKQVRIHSRNIQRNEWQRKFWIATKVVNEDVG